MRVSLSWHLPASVESPKVQEMYNSQINMTTQNLIPREEIFCFLLLLPPPLVFLCKFRFLKVGRFKINAHLNMVSTCGTFVITAVLLQINAYTY